MPTEPLTCPGGAWCMRNRHQRPGSRVMFPRVKKNIGTAHQASVTGREIEEEKKSLLYSIREMIRAIQSHMYCPVMRSARSSFSGPIQHQYGVGELYGCVVPLFTRCPIPTKSEV